MVAAHSPNKSPSDTPAPPSPSGVFQACSIRRSTLRHLGAGCGNYDAIALQLSILSLNARSGEALSPHFHAASRNNKSSPLRGHASHEQDPNHRDQSHVQPAVSSWKTRCPTIILPSCVAPPLNNRASCQFIFGDHIRTTSMPRALDARPRGQKRGCLEGHEKMNRN